MVDLKAKPYNLKDEDIKWVNETIASMTDEEKIGQLFVNMGSSRDEDYLKEMVTKYHIGAVRYNPGKAEEVYEQNRVLQENSKIPLLIAANTESGGNGACTDGTYVGVEVKIAATNDSKYAYELGRVSGVEAAAIGCNWSFAPIVDINRNWRNPIISSRTFCDDPDKTLELALEYMKGIRESGIAPAAKHFPGDGIDERDQHLSFSVNSLSTEEWDETFGKVYSGLFEAGIPSIMAGHISLPSYVRHFNPDATLQEAMMPATLSKYILIDLLRGKMGFNGLVVTDASHMVALTGSMRRKDMVPAAIAAGNDLFLFFNDPDEDFRWMMEGYKNGVITEERLNEALTRILGTKATLGLHKKDKKEILPPKEQAMARIGLEENKKPAIEVADKAITLVKNNQEIFPISAENHKRVLLVDVKGTEGGFGKLIGSSGPSALEIMKGILEEEGFEVTVWESPTEKIMKLPEEEMKKAIGKVYAQKRPISDLTDNYDLVINIASVNPNTDQRIQWPASKGTPDIPFYVNELPTIFISVQCPFHLADVPQVKTYINAYDNKDYTIKALVDKMMGRSEFMGVSPVDAFCGFEDTRF
ncbi:glycoside hydrolase family 3 protein [Alkalibacter saccharofermentans]|uniref:beta-N-acetylhexosaminidase n=1 Tax=Alkalibacter saccharofermentans DSM 14828 TaxID=1120975 RepID=A0A1M4W2K8_9FIRM|nr:glycoside hydrolase family 3 N-terminal domain-containing protein [Alkalibacter saccharofermentans]SHE75202.1 beta-N-acetylhexosaminidase [Alkalibacter saccharofermentans DSM 14828]